MLADIPILSIITFSPLIGVLILLFMPKELGKWIRIIATAATLLPLTLSVWLFTAFNQQSDKLQFNESYTWIKIPLNQGSQLLQNFTSYFFKLQYSMAIDGLSLTLVVMTAIIATMAALAAVHIKKRWKLFFILFLLLEVGMLGVFMARDLLLFFVFFEVTLVTTFFLIGIWGFQDREKAANRFLIYNGIGSAVMLIAFLVIGATAGFTETQTIVDDEMQVHLHYSFDYDQIIANLNNADSLVNYSGKLFGEIANPIFMSDQLKWTMFLLLLIAFGIKLPIFPFHTWMLRVHAEAPPSIVMIHSGILLKMGAYGLIRYGVLLFPEQAKSWSLILAILGLVNILYGAFLAWRQSDFKLVLAYSSISHMGVILFGIAAWNHIGLQGAIFQMISHGLISAMLFLLVGSLYERTGTTHLSELGGLAKSIPFTSGMLLFAGLATLGLPGLSGFISEFLSFVGLFDTQPIVTAIGTLGIIFSAVYVLRAVLRITFGPIRDTYTELKDARLIEVVPMIVLAAFILLIGIYPAILSDPLRQTIDVMIANLSMKVGG